MQNSEVTSHLILGRRDTLTSGKKNSWQTHYEQQARRRVSIPALIQSGMMNPIADGSTVELPVWLWLVWFDAAAHAEISGG